MGILYSNRYNKNLVDYEFHGYNDIFNDSEYYSLLVPKYPDYMLSDILVKHYFYNVGKVIYYFKTEQDMSLFKLKYNI